jgi:hypothetical protein
MSTSAKRLPQKVDSQGSPPHRTPMSLKDKAALVIATISLLVSFTTFGLNRWEKYRDTQMAAVRHSYAAFHLGDRFATTFVAFHQATVGDEEKIRAFRAEVLRSLQPAQASADKLDLRMNLRTFIEDYKPGENLIPESVTTTLASRLRAERGGLVSDHFLLGFWLAWYAVNVGIAEKDHPDFLALLQERYPHYRATVNPLLKAAGSPEYLPESVPSVSTLPPLLKKLRDATKSSLEARAL